MKKCFAALIAAGIAFLLGFQAASAQTLNVYAVKFVCGVQKPVSTFNAPQEPVVKPGNYATLVNIEYVALGEAGETLTYRIVVDPPYQNYTGGNFHTIHAFQPDPFDCEGIANIVGIGNAGAPSFITGFLNIIVEQPVVITTTYTSQGCTSFGTTGTVGALAVPTKPVCTGPVSIEVVPQPEPVQVERPS